MSSTRNLAFVKNVFNFITKGKGFDLCMKDMSFVSAGNGKCNAELTVCEEHLNRFGGLHGGFIATLVDNISTYALLTKDESSPGVSVDLHVSYMKAAKLGDVIVIDANVIRTGQNLAYLECEIRNKIDNSIIAKGMHTKFLGIQMKLNELK